LDWNTQFILPVLGSLVAGAAIGAEREYRGRPAGLRTHILVCLASSLLMLAAVHQVVWMGDTPLDVVRIDPVRMAHGILTGIGFLCGGVIFREGFSVHGLTTAASLWITSALGTLYGVGFYQLAIGGTVITLGVLAALRLANVILPQLHIADLKVQFRQPDAPSQAGFLAMLKDLDLASEALTHRLTRDPACVEFSTTLRTGRGARLDALAERLTADPALVSFEIAPRND
jgi:putative Mg2+ transporter-C (MgtC) family protein